MTDYDYRDYWKRLHGRGGLSGVGQQSLDDRVNAWLYRARRRNLGRFMDAHQLRGGRLLEVGVGTGYWVPFWKQRGYRVDGCDLVASATEEVQRDHPDGRFWAADVSSPDGIRPPGAADDGDEGYDVVAAIDVLLHVTDDDAFQQALANLVALVRPGGHLLLAEPALVHTKNRPPYHPKYSSRARLLRSYRRPLRDLGMRFVAVAPTTVLGNNPIEARTPRRLALYRRWWELVRASSAHPWRARVIGPLMYAADAALVRTGESPTSKVLLFRRKRVSATQADPWTP
jgi:2-polyprenyl-3-methyl-5-hydroxy-6-metoxy-1,4-benzoquinol methylase